VPVPFLVVKQASFAFGIAPRITGEPESDQANKKACDHALQQLELALQWMGAGAKTGAGYGRMFNPEQRTAQSLKKSGVTLSSGVVWEKVSESAKDLVRKNLFKCPDARIEAVEALNHPFLARGKELNVIKV
jgi:serine/threonine protein kinase